jgi:hypothetical protein
MPHLNSPNNKNKDLNVDNKKPNSLEHKKQQKLNKMKN